MSRNGISAINRMVMAVMLTALGLGTGQAVAAMHVDQSAVVIKAAHHDLSHPLSDTRWDLPPIMQRVVGNQHLSAQRLDALRNRLVKSGLMESPDSASQPAARGTTLSLSPRVMARDEVVQGAAPATQSGGFTTPLLSFDGLGSSTQTISGYQYSPPDISIAVGMNYAVEAIDNEYAVYDKTNGTMLFGPVAFQGLWSGFNGVCAIGYMKHPEVVYDQLAHRWIFIAALPFSSSLCIAISKTNDPSGEFYRYEYDHLKPFGPLGHIRLGVWTNAYYVTANKLNFSQSITSVSFIALDRSAMLQGQQSQMVVFNLPKSSGVYADLPATLEGLTPPPAGEPGLFANYSSPNLFGAGQPYALMLWKLQVDWANPQGATLQGPFAITVPAFNDMLCSNQAACIPQPYPGVPLDAVSDRLMPGLAYRNFGDHEALAVNQTVTTSSSTSSLPAAIRWYELDTSSPGAGDWSLKQSGTYDPADGSSRWMGSLAMDDSGDMALGYSLASANIAPAIDYTGRQSGDASGKMTQAETTLVAGIGVQIGTFNANVWGTYSSMEVDPADGCTFWYGNEYYESTGQSHWSTHLGAFRFNACTPAAVGALHGTVSGADSGKPISGATISVAPGTVSPGDIVAGSAQDGSYQFKLAAGDYTATAAEFGYLPETLPASVAAGGSVTDDFSLQPAPTATLSGHVRDGSGHGYGLYAEVKITTQGIGEVADVWTDPATGAYSATLPKGFDYTLSVTPYLDGYNTPNNVTVTLDQDKVEDFVLTITSTCTAPGYAFNPGYGEDFNGTFPPAGWTVITGSSGPHVVWNTNTYWGDDNWTGGTGTAAAVDSYAASNQYGNPGAYDTSLVSPPIAVTSLPPTPMLRYKANFRKYWFPNALDVDIRVDGGSWTTLLHWTRSYGGFHLLPGYDVQIPLSSYIPNGASNIQFRWRYYDLYHGADWYAEIDDVAIGACQPTAGGLVTGEVFDANTGLGLNGAAISSGSGLNTTTFSNSGDTARPAGTYLMFAPSGQYTLTASNSRYSSSNAQINVTDNAVVTQNFPLGAGLFSANPGALTLHIVANTKQDETLVVDNSGTASGHFVLQPINVPPSSTQGTPAGPFASAPQYALGTDLNAYSAVAKNALPQPGHNIVKAYAAAPQSAGTVVDVFAAPIPFFSLGVERSNDSLWLGSPSYRGFGGDDRDHKFTFDGTDTGDAINVAFPSVLYMADMAYDDVTETLWQLSVDKPATYNSPSLSHIYELDPRTLAPTGQSVAVPSRQGEKGLAYNPVDNTWYAGDFNSGAIYHFDASGKLLDSAFVGLPIQGLAYNPSTGHLFVLTSGGTHAIYVLDAKNGYAQVGDFDIKGFDPATAGAGLDYTCDNNLWITDFVDQMAVEIASGESGWCAVRHIPWLSLSPASGTVGQGAAANVTVSIDGTGQQPYTTSSAQLKLVGDTPYPIHTIPVTVTWDPQPVALVTTVQANPNPVVEGNYLTFQINVENTAAQGDGPASQVAVTFTLPSDLQYVPRQGDGCTQAGNSLTCSVGDIASGVTKQISVVTQVVSTDGNYYSVTFTAAGREQQDSQYAGRNSQTVTGAITASGNSGGTSGSGGSSGGGSLGGLSLTVLLGLALAAALWRGRLLFMKPLNRENAVSRRTIKPWAVGSFVLAAVLGVSIATVQARAGESMQHGGLTAQSLANMQRSAGTAGSQLARLAPQTNTALLEQATVVGPHSLTSTIKLTVSLKLRNVTQLQWFIRELQNPASAEYHHFLTPAQFTKRYGPTAAQVAQVTQYLEARGIKVTSISPNRMLVHTEATTNAYEDAFEIRINDYTLHGRKFFSTTDSPQLPSEVAGLIRNVIGLNNAVQLRPLHRVGALALASSQTASGAPPPSSSYYEPAQIATAYDWPSITDSRRGAGVDVAILTANSSGLSANDYNTFWSDLGLPGHTVNIIPVDGDQSNTNGTLETLLDIEWSGAMGPGETQNVYIASNASLGTFLDEFNQFTNDNTSQVMTTSWGAPETSWGSLALTADQIFMQAAAQGISMFAAAGDRGSGDGTGNDNVLSDFPSVDPYITAANGTELTSSFNGNYQSETAWSGTGGAISQIFSQPTWQTGPGVPANGWRNNSDMAMNAGPLRPYVIYDQLDGGWLTVYGTSAVAPQFAGLFAIGVWQNGGASLGQSNELIYSDVNAGNYASDFHDVTTGSNGAFNAGPNWDHPTGWGSPRAQSLLSHLGVQGPVGTLQGTVTDAATGATIADALVTVTPGNFHRATGSDGTYSLLLAPGSYTATVEDFGYAVASAPFSITAGTTTTQNFALQAATEATVSGRVTDGSGHGYGLYAEIKVNSPQFGQVADVWTDPKTGDYSLSLPEGFDYTFSVTAALDGYADGSWSITKLNADATHDFVLPVSGSCTAPGYHFIQGFGEDFNGSSFPPAGWTVKTYPGVDPARWKKAGPNLFGTLPNWTGGTGDAAVGEANGTVILNSPYDTRLITPPIAVTSLPPDPTVTFLVNYQHKTADDALDVDINIDGQGWTTVAHITHSLGAFAAYQGAKYSASLAGYIPSGANSIQLRWRYYNLVNYYGWYAEIDDVSIGACETVPGGLVYGQVSDGNTGNGIVGAAVSDESGDKTQTIENSADPNLPVGAYLYFVPAGQHTITASDYAYADTSADLSITEGTVTVHNFALDAGKLAADPLAITVHAMVNSQTQQTLNIGNTGTVAASYDLLDINAPTGSAAVSDYFTGDNALPLKSTAANPAAQTAGPLTPEVLAAGSGYVLAASASTAPGSVVSTFHTGIPSYGLGLNRDTGALWVGSPALNGGDDKDHRFLPDGTNTGGAIDVGGFGAAFMADMAYDANTGKLWQLSVTQGGVSSCIYELDPRLMQWTGKKICPSFPISQRGLAYDPVTNIWIAGDFHSEAIYGFDSNGRIVGSISLGEPIIGLAFNRSTQHLFVLTSGGAHAIYVFNAANNFIDPPTTIDIPGFNPQNAGAGLSYDCAGHLWVSDFVDDQEFEVNSGETGWCDYQQIPWLSVAPRSGTVSAGDSAQVALDIDGTGEQPFTSTQVQLRLTGTTPYPVQSIPLTVIWDPQPAALLTTVTKNPNPVVSGNYLTFNVAVKNATVQGDSGATQVALSFDVPAELQYVHQKGDGCSEQGITVTCSLGDIAQGDTKQISIMAQAIGAGGSYYQIAFSAAGREPQNNQYAGRNSQTITGAITASGNSGGTSGTNGGGSGGGGLGGLALAALLGLALAGVWARRRG